MWLLPLVCVRYTGLMHLSKVMVSTIYPIFQEPFECFHYATAGEVDLNVNRPSPDWMTERSRYFDWLRYTSGPFSRGGGRNKHIDGIHELPDGTFIVFESKGRY